MRFGVDFTSARLFRLTYEGLDGEYSLEYEDVKPEEIDLPEGLVIRPSKTSPHYVRPRGDGRSGGGGIIG